MCSLLTRVDPDQFDAALRAWHEAHGSADSALAIDATPGDVVETCTILTTAANEAVAPVHGRMPVILPEDTWDAWLAGEEVPLAPYPAGGMTAHPVSTLVNKLAHDDPRCVEPVGQEPDGG